MTLAINTSSGLSMASGETSRFSAWTQMVKQSAAKKTALANAPTTSTRAKPKPTESDMMSDSMLKESEMRAMEFPMYPDAISAVKNNDMTRPISNRPSLKWRYFTQGKISRSFSF
uniref:Monooxygenase p33MONOX n=1 Tax=Pygocentrus nattereri TaxID=42514 RepID=A0AAR2IVJ7_PYGNA